MNIALMTVFVKIGLIAFAIAFTAITESHYDFFKAVAQELQRTKFPKLFCFKGEHFKH